MSSKVSRNMVCFSFYLKKSFFGERDHILSPSTNPTYVVEILIDHQSGRAAIFAINPVARHVHLILLQPASNFKVAKCFDTIKLEINKFIPTY